MALARIDRGVILQLIAIRLQADMNLTAMDKWYPGDSTPNDASKPFVQVVAVDFSQFPRSRGGESNSGGDVPDFLRTVVTLAVSVPEEWTRVSLRSLDAVMGWVVEALSERTLIQDGGTHRLRLTHAAESKDPWPDDSGAIRTGTITINAVAMREAGSTIST